MSHSSRPGDDAVPSVPLEALQGDWIASRGETIRIEGRELSINGQTVPGGLKFSPDGSRVLGFSIYRLQQDGMARGGQMISWHAGPQEIVWRRADASELQGRIERMGSAISSANEGLAAAANTGGQGFNVDSEREAVMKLNAIIERWRVGPLLRVRSCDICPDWTNRSQTGLSLDHVHYVATLISQNGFKSRRRGRTTAQGAHDVPVLVCESAGSELGRGALEKWRRQVAENPELPPFYLDGRSEFYCSLGNGHFSQALNLFRAGAENIWAGGFYSIGTDEHLREAVEDGVESVVLSRDMPVNDRRFVAEMLNRAHGRTWHIGDDGRVSIDGDVPAISGSQFVALSKVLDAEELSCLVRQKLGVDVDRQSPGAVEDGGLGVKELRSKL